MNHSPSTTLPPDPLVWRLYQGDKAVGFGKHFGAGMMWSRTGAAYSGREIPHTVQVRGLPLRTPSGTPIFHGDVISPPGDDSDRYLVLGEGDALLFARAGSGTLVRRERSAFSQRRDFVRHGNVIESVHFSRAFDAALRAYAAREFSAGPPAWSLSAWTLAGCIGAGMLQAQLRAGVGPILSCLGGVALGWIFFFAWKLLFPESFRRSTTSRVAEGAVWRTALLFSTAYGAAGFLGMPGVASSSGGVLAGMSAAAVFGVGVAFVSGVLAADTLTRRQDHKLGLDSELRSFIDVSGPFLRVRPAASPAPVEPRDPSAESRGLAR